MAKKKKKVTRLIKLQIPAGGANPSQPVGPAFGQHGVNMMEFSKAFNAETQSQTGMIIPGGITVFAARSFSLFTKIHTGIEFGFLISEHSAEN